MQLKKYNLGGGGWRNKESKTGTEYHSLTHLTFCTVIGWVKTHNKILS
jgi:hypothetical protein